MNRSIATSVISYARLRAGRVTLSARTAFPLTLLTVFFLCLGWTTGASAHSNVRLATQNPEDPLQVEPRVVGYTGDGTGYLGGQETSPRQQDRGGLRWLSWGHRIAAARGYAWLNNCRPDCARGAFHPYRAKIRVRRPRNGLFTRLVIKVSYRGRWVYDHRALRHIPASDYEGEYYPGYYEWDICGSRYTKPC